MEIEIASDIPIEELKYRQFVVICEVDECKENVPVDTETDVSDAAKRPKTNKRQFEKIIEFAKAHNEDNTGKSMLNDLWETLAGDLNKMGQPTRTAMQWRRVWSVYKYNTKRAESSAVSSELSGQTRVHGSCRNASKGRSSGDRSNIREKSRSPICSSGCKSFQEIPTDEKMLIQLGLLVQQQGKMLQNQESIIAKLDKSNDMLAELSGKKIIEKSPNGPTAEQSRTASDPK